MCNDINLQQLVNFATRGENILDLLFSNNTSMLCQLTEIPGISDHTSAVIADVNCSPVKSKSISRKIYKWNNVDLPLLKSIVKEKVFKFCESGCQQHLSLEEI